MPDDIEQAPRRRSALGEIVRPGGVDLELPEVPVVFRREAVVDAGKLAVDAVGPGRGDSAAGREGGVEFPAERVRDEVAPGPLRRGPLGGPPEENVAVGDG